MTDRPADTPPPPDTPDHPDDAHAQPLPAIRTALTGDEIVRRLDGAARRGRLAGYATLVPATREADGALFEIRDFGAPVEGVLRGRLEGGTLRFDLAMQPKLLIVLAIILTISVWPGVWFTESLLASMFPLTPWAWKWTAWWYLPTAIISAPWVMWVVVTRSRASIDAGARELITKVEQELSACAIQNAAPVPPPPSPVAAQPAQPTPR